MNIYAPWNILKWFGRVLLWVTFFPLGIWRSLHHSQMKSERRIRAEMKRL